jgi:heat shock protein HslJ
MRSVLISLVVAALLAVGFAPGEDARAQTVVTPEAGTTSAAAIPPIVWNLIAFPGVGQINEPGRYTVQFLQDGQVSARADCNWVAGLWTVSGGALDVTITQSTLAGCPEDSLEQPFTMALHEATSYTLDGFLLTVSGPSGTMQFAPEMPAMA